MRNASRIIVLSLALVTSGASLAGQAPSRVAADARIRVTTIVPPSGTRELVVGDLVAVDSQAIVLRRAAGGDLLTVPLSIVSRLEMRRQPPRAKYSTALGAAIGLAAGFLVGEAAASVVRSTPDELPRDPETHARDRRRARRLVIGSSLVGVVGGAVVGFNSGRERWTEVVLLPQFGARPSQPAPPDSSRR